MTILTPPPLMRPETWDRIAGSTPAETRALLRDLIADQPRFHLAPEGYNPWLHAVRAEVPVEYADTTARAPGALGITCWDQHGNALVVLHPEVDYVQERSTLTHELIHVAVGPQGGCPPEVDQRIEAAIDQIAALRLIHYRAAALWQVQQVGVRRAAEHLHVDEPLMKAFLDVAAEQGLYRAEAAAA